MALMALMVPMFAAVAYAAVIYGTDNRDVLYETRRNDQMYGYGGNDTLKAQRFGGDRDVLYGGAGNDVLRARDGDGLDTLRGGPGYDRCFGDVGDAFFNCEEINGVVQ